MFSQITGLRVYSGKYVFKSKIYEADAIIIGTEYALLIECKRKGISRKARGGERKFVIKDISEAYFSSQRQAYHTYGAIKENEGVLALYPSECNISTDLVKNDKFNDKKIIADFTSVKNIIRVSCTAGNFWISAEAGIVDIIEGQVEKAGAENNDYFQGFIQKRNVALAYENLSVSSKKIVKLNRLFIAFDKLYSMVVNAKFAGKTGDSLLKYIWLMTRMQSKKGDTMNSLAYLAKITENVQ